MSADDMMADSSLSDGGKLILGTLECGEVGGCMSYKSKARRQGANNDFGATGAVKHANLIRPRRPYQPHHNGHALIQ